MVRDAAWGCDWIGTPVSFQRCLVFIINSANKGFTLTAGKFVPVSNNTMLNVRTQCTISWRVVLKIFSWQRYYQNSHKRHSDIRNTYIFIGINTLISFVSDYMYNAIICPRLYTYAGKFRRIWYTHENVSLANSCLIHQTIGRSIRW